MLTVSLLMVMPKNFSPIVTVPEAVAPLLEVVFDTSYQEASVMEVEQLTAVQVADVPVYVYVPVNVARHSSAPLLVRQTYILLPLRVPDARCISVVISTVI